MVELGRLQRVDPKTIWPHEAHDFTPWLAEHLELLGQALGLDLERVEQEVSVGEFCADIVAADGAGRRVVIENQLDKSDHTHLGQLITYAAGLDASVVVWICPEVRDEHREAIDWLNRGHPNTDFFALVLEVLKIDDSKPAVNLRPVAFPNEWTRRKSAPSELMLRYQRFFQGVIDELRETHQFTNAKKAQPCSYYAFRSGFGGFRYAVCFGNKGLRTELYLSKQDAPTNQKIFERLHQQKDRIEGELGQPLSWEPLQGKQACRIALYLPDASIEAPEQALERYRRWAIEHLLKLRKVFGPRLAQACAPRAQTTRS